MKKHRKSISIKIKDKNRFLFLICITIFMMSSGMLTGCSSSQHDTSPEGIIMEGIDVPEPVLEKAKEFVSKQFEAAQENFINYNYSNWRIKSLSLSSLSVDSDAQLYEVRYEFLSDTPENISLPDDINILDNGWLWPNYPYTDYLLFWQEEEELSYLANIQEVLVRITGFDKHGISFDAVEWIQVPSERSDKLHVDNSVDAPNGYIVYNAEELTEELPFAENCSCLLLDPHYVTFAPVTLEELLADLTENHKHTLYHLRIQDGKIVQVREQYEP